MAVKLTSEDARQSLNDHVAVKGADIFAKYGPEIGWSELWAILEDRTYVRYPVKIEFTTDGLMEGEFAYPSQNGEAPEDGFTLRIHPVYMTNLAEVSLLALYQLVMVNYGDFASDDDAVTFGAHCLGMTEDDYYNAVCELADRVAGPDSVGSCGCGGMTAG